MLSRRLLRAVVMQALYAFFLSENDNIEIAEKTIVERLNKIFTLYFTQISFILKIVEHARERMEDGKTKYTATDKDLNPNNRFVENPLIQQLKNNKQYLSNRDSFIINWADYKELVRNIFNSIRNGNDYVSYMESKIDYETDKKFVVKIFKKFIMKNQSLQSLYEEKNIYWADDYDLINIELIKVLNSFTETSDDTVSLLKQKDTFKDDVKFINELFRKTIIRSAEYEDMISDIIKNWETERVATIDMLLMKMAICEILDFPEIPVKVSLNEYIEIAKLYSTPKSSTFINGVLDKLLDRFKKEEKIIKTGRGIIEN